MNFDVKTTLPDKEPCECVVIGLFETGEMTRSTQQIDSVTNGYITNLFAQGDISGKAGQTLLLQQLPNVKARRVLLVGLGNPQQLTETSFRDALMTAFTWLKDRAYKDCMFCLTDVFLKRDIHWLARETVLRCHDAFYQFDQFKQKKTEQPKLTKVTIYAPLPQDISLAEEAMREGIAIAAGMNFTKDLGNLPANVCTPTYLATEATALAKAYSKLKVQVFDEKHLQKMGMNAFMAVAKGSNEPGKLVILEYHGGNKAAKPIALIGKGITFDSGGISLKPSLAMDEMKFDMGGAASILGTLKTAAELNLPINIVAAIACAENMPSGNACKPGDIVKTYSGLTVEILNTDAEGRLVLCDTLTYIAEKYNPEVMIDLATLTGAMIVALGFLATGLFSNNDALAADIEQAANQSFDRVWRLPLWSEYAKALESNFADMANIPPDRAANSIIAGCFLEKFVKDIPWAHLDIAGTSCVLGKNKGSTGRPVPLLVQYLLNKSRD